MSRSFSPSVGFDRRSPCLNCGELRIWHHGHPMELCDVPAPHDPAPPPIDEPALIDEALCAQRDKLAVMVRELLKRFDRGAYMTHEDQKLMWAAESLLVEVKG